MTIRPITLRDWQARAAQEGRLGLIVVPLKVQPEFSGGIAGGVTSPCSTSIAIYPEHLGGPNGLFQESPFYSGDLLWCRETWCNTEDHGLMYKANSGIEYSWRSPVTMPKWASRTTLHVKAVDVRRMQDITEDESRMAGCRGYMKMLNPLMYEQISARQDFAAQFPAFDENPWCAFARVKHG